MGDSVYFGMKKAVVLRCFIGDSTFFKAVPFFTDSIDAIDTGLRKSYLISHRDYTFCDQDIRSFY